jgi:ATP-dependent protease Clp ATPase subunit
VMQTCSFCGKSEHQVGLYGGPQVAICTECVRMMYEDIGPVEPKPRPESEGETIVSFSASQEVKPAPPSEGEK